MICTDTMKRRELLLHQRTKDADFKIVEYTMVCGYDG